MKIRCPYCGSYESHIENIYEDPSTITYTVICKNCKKEFNAIYEFANYSDIDDNYIEEYNG